MTETNTAITLNEILESTQSPDGDEAESQQLDAELTKSGLNPSEYQCNVDKRDALRSLKYLPLEEVIEVPPPDIVELHKASALLQANDPTVSKGDRVVGAAKNDAEPAQEQGEAALFTEADLGEPLKFSDLLHHDFANDPDNLLGKDRWLGRCGSLFIIGQSGAGKSSLNAQLVVGWALPRPELTFNIETNRPLRQLIIQNENDKGDLAEMVQGVQNDLELSAGEIQQIDDMVLWRRITTLSGDAFLAAVEELIERSRPDICWIDPFLAYLEGDASKQENLAEFLYRGLTPISERTGVIFAAIHHTGKPVKDKVEMTESDLAYMGLGSSVITNWAREVLVLNRVHTADGEPPTFRLTATKRRLRAGMATMAAEGEGGSGQPTTNIYIRHSTSGSIKWEQCPAPEKRESGRETKPQNNPEKLAEMLALAGAPLSHGQLKELFIQSGGKEGSFKNVLRDAKGGQRKPGKNNKRLIDQDKDGKYIPAINGSYALKKEGA